MFWICPPGKNPWGKLWTRSLDLFGNAFAPSCKEEVIAERDNQQKMDG